MDGHDWRHLVQTKASEINRLNSVYGKILDNFGVGVAVGHKVALKYYIKDCKNLCSLCMVLEESVYDLARNQG